MGKEVVLFSSEETKDRGGVVEFLRMLADKIDQGQVTLRQGEEDVQLIIPPTLVLEVKVEEEAKKQGRTQRSLEVELEWYEGEDVEDRGVSLA